VLPTRFETVVNTKTAKELRLAIPTNVLASADEVALAAGTVHYVSANFAMVHPFTRMHQAERANAARRARAPFKT
jgi:hypothetical protein